MLTYDAEGGYGHPDHVRAHEVALAAVDPAGWRTPLVLAVASPRSAHEAGVARLRARGLTTLEPPWPSVVVDDEAVTHRVVAEGYRAAKAAALRAHATQVVVADDEQAYALSNGVWHDLTVTESYRALRS